MSEQKTERRSRPGAPGAEVVVRLPEESSALLAAIVDSSDDAIISKDLNGVITSWNKSAERLFGYTAREAVGQPITMLIPPERPNEEAGILASLRRGERIDHLETVRVRKDGTRLHISVTSSPVRDREGRIVGASKIARDITERKKAEAALKEADRRKDEFLAMLAHELRNPLAPISNAVQLLRMAEGNEKAVRAASDMLERQVGQLVQLVDDLVDVNRFNRGRIKLRKQRIQLAPVIAQSVEALRPVCDALHHTLTCSLPPQPIYVNADPTRLVQAISNLLNNACKFTDHGGHVQLTVERESDQAVIRVRDTGVGIAADQLSRIFEMFAQLDTSLERSRGGLGIGLTLVGKIVELHDGTVEAHSAGVAQGSEFVIRLPIASELPVSLPQKPSRPEKPAEARHRVLVVDDNRDAAESLALLLQLSGHEVQTAHDGPEAVAAAATFRPDVILLDIGLPELNGYEVARRIRTQGRDDGVRLIAVTGRGMEVDRRRSRDAGFDAHIVKPVDYAALTKLLAKLDEA